MPVKRSKQKFDDAIPELMSELKLANTMAVPRLEKIVISVGTAKSKDPKRMEIVMDRLSKITGQKPKVTIAKKSIATFKLRAGDKSGVMVTLRGQRAYDFLDRLIHVAIPRERDFRGLRETSIDEMGNISLGFKEHTIFPETADEDIKDVFPFGVTLTTTAKSKEAALALFNVLGLPFKS